MVMKIEHSFEFAVDAWELGASYADQPDASKVLRMIDTGAYHSPVAFLEVVNKQDYPSAGSAKLLYWTGSAWSDVPDATVTWGAGDIRVRGSQFNLISGAVEYKVQAYRTSSPGTYLHHLRVILKDSATTIDKTESQHQLGQSLSLTGSAWKNFGAFWTNNPSLRDGSVSIYFEATFYQNKTSGSSASKTGYIGFRKDGTEDPPVVQVATTSNVPVRVRSAAFTPEDAHYTPAAKHATSSNSVYVTSVAIVVTQTSMTKTYITRHLDFEGYKDQGDGGYARHYAQQYLDPAEYEGFDKVFKLNSTFKQALGGGSGLPKMPWTAYICFTKDGNFQTSYNVNTTATYYVELFSSDYGANFVAAEYDSGSRQTDANKSTVHKAVFIRLELTKSAAPPPSAARTMSDGLTCVCA